MERLEKAGATHIFSVSRWKFQTDALESITPNKKLSIKIFWVMVGIWIKIEETVDIIVATAWPIHPASLAYALDLRIYYIKNKVSNNGW